MSTTKTMSPADLLAKTKSNLATPNAAPMPIAAAPEVPEVVYQVYHSSLKSMKMITPEGTPVIFMDHKTLTDVPEVISYLESEISSRKCAYLSKGESVKSSELDPIANLRKKIIAEYEAEKLAGAKQDHGQYESGKLDPASTNSVPQASASSSSAE